MIFYNQVYQYVDRDEKNRIRIIEVDELVAYFVELEGDTAMPKTINLADLETEIQSSVLLLVSDPYLMTYVDKDLKKVQKEKRDEDWNIVSIGWDLYKKELLNKKQRNEIFEELAENNNVSKLKVKRSFTRFWQRGLRISLVFTHHQLCSEMKSGRTWR